jgi:U3 small nucleolar RNA-associated protein 10
MQSSLIPHITHLFVSGNLQYLDVADMSNYIKFIIDSKDLIVQDGNYMQIFHQQHLSRTKSDSKAVAKCAIYLSDHCKKNVDKGVRYKQRILSYLLSHVGAISLPSAKTALLKSMTNVSDGVKAQLLLPVIQGLVRGSIGDPSGSFEEYATLVVSTFDKSSSDILNETSSASWPVFVSVLRQFFQSGTSANDVF